MAMTGAELQYTLKLNIDGAKRETGFPRPKVSVAYTYPPFKAIIIKLRTNIPTSGEWRMMTMTMDSQRFIPQERQIADNGIVLRLIPVYWGQRCSLW